MSDLFESIKQGANQVLSEIDQKGQLKAALSGIRLQLSEVERRRRVSSLEKEVKTLQGEMKQLTEALGLQTLSLHDTGKVVHPELSRLCERINELRSEVEATKAELTALKVPAVRTAKCPKCQAEVGAGAEFCPKCGAQLQVRAAASPPAPAAKTRTIVRLRCPKCKTVLPQEAGFCPTCGVKIKRPQARPAQKRFCSSCGAQVGPDSQFCPACGQPAASTS
jgi:RNA polymerase subunit RPABC4/transcription elongation factor Spt4